VFERPKFACSTKAGLNLVKGQHDFVFVTPSAEFLNVFNGRKIWADALVAFHDDPSDLGWPHAAFFDPAEEGFKAAILLPVAIGEGAVDDGAVEIDDPFLLASHPACLLRGKRATVEAALKSDDSDLFPAADFDAVGAGEFDRALSRFRPGAEEKGGAESLG
jgi:hypothetical protein